MKKINNKSILYYTLLIISLYLVFYRPIFNLGGYKLSCYKILLIIELCFFAINNNVKILSRFFGLFKKEFSWLILILLLVLLRTLGGGDKEILIGNAKTLIGIALNSCFIVCLANKLFNRSEERFLKLILVVGTIAAVISTLCVINEDIRYWIDHSVQYYDEEDKQVDYIIRCFGLSSVLLFDYGIVQGILFALGIVFIKNNKWFLVVFPFMVLSIILNARTGVVVTVASVFTYFLLSGKMGTLVKTSILMALIICAFLLILPRLNLAEGSKAFMKDFTDTVILFFNGDFEESTTYMDWTANNPWPRTIGEWFFGIGKNIMNVRGRNTDIGYLVQLLYGGLFYFIPLYMFLYMLFKKWNKCNKGYSYIFLAAYLVSNIKGNVIGSSIFDCLLIFYFYSVVSSKKYCL